MNPEVQERLRNCKSLPTLPGVAVELVDLCQRDDVEMVQIADTIGKDPALCARVLEIVNSSASGLSRRVETLDHAVALLGVHAVKTVALSFSMIRGLRQGDSSQDLSNFWRRSLVAAVAARSLARWRKLADPEAVFLAALLQDIGILALRVSFPEYAGLVHQSGGDHQALSQMELLEWDGDHAEVSAWLAQRWNLPEVFQVSLRGSHEAKHSQATEEQLPIVQSVALSGDFADIWTGPDPEGATQRARAGAAELGMADSEVEEMLGIIADGLPELASLFEIEVGDTETINRILEQAKESLIAVSLQTVQHARELASQNQDLKTRNQTDALTGVYNRAYLDDALERSLEYARIKGQPMTVVFCDLDHFKKVNDTYGHQAGDQILISTAKILAQEVRQNDLVGRYGGEEFLLILPRTDQAGAAVLCERICRKVASQTHVHSPEQSIRVTISLGHATQTPGGEFPVVSRLVEAADQALYRAKEAGRNRFVAYTSLAAEPPVPVRVES